MQKVTADQIAHLYDFSRKHYVEYYDLQTELVDHLANGIEKQWIDNEHIPFENALKRENRKKWMFEDLIKKYGMGQCILWFPYYIFVNSFVQLDLEQPSDVASIFVVSLIGISFLLGYLIFVDIPRKAALYLKEVYPEYKMV